MLVTNPPFSGEHVPKILSFCARQGAKPWLLLMPNYVYLKVHTMNFVLGTVLNVSHVRKNRSFDVCYDIECVLPSARARHDPTRTAAALTPQYSFLTGFAD